MAVVANVAINVDSRGASAKLKQVANQSKELQRAAEKTTAGLQKQNSSLGVLARGALKLAAAYATLNAAQSAFRAGIARIESERRIEFLAKGYGEVTQLQNAATKAAKRFGTSQTEANKALADVFARLRPVGVSLGDIVSVYNGFNTAARISGSSAVESANAFRQLSQALGSGALRGDEFNSISEQVPGILTAISKETGVAQGQLRKYAAEGKITADVVIRALKRIEAEGANQLASALGGPEQAIRDFQNASEDLQVALTNAIVPEMASAFRDLAAIIQGLEPAIRFIGGLIAQTLSGFRTLVDSVRGGEVVDRLRKGGGLGLRPVKEKEELRSFFGDERFGELEQQARETSSKSGQPFAVALEDALKVAIEAKDAVAATANQYSSMPEKIVKAVDAAGVLTNRAKEHLTSVRNASSQIQNQITALDGAQSVEAARLDALKATNNLERQRLTFSFQYAKNAQEASNIAIALFNNQVQAANLEAQSKLASLEYDRQKLALQAELQSAKIDEIYAEGELQKLKASSIEDEAKRIQKIQEINAQTQNAVNAQANVAAQARKQIDIQDQIIQFQQNSIEAVRQQRIEAAAVELKQKLVSEKIQMSADNASQLAVRLQNSAVQAGNGAQGANNLATGLNRAATNAQNTSTMMIQVATQANNAANAINNAAAAQQRLNAARAAQAQAPQVQAAADGAYWPGGFKAFAEGGVVNKPTMGLVGEGGESEYIIPASKMRAAMERYASGARGSSVIPNSTGGGGGGMAPNGQDMMPSINPSVNVTTGPVMNMNGANYVSQNDFVAGLQSASRRGAEMAIQMLRSGGGMRKRLGVG